MFSLSHQDDHGISWMYHMDPYSSCFHHQELETDAGKAQPFLKALKKPMLGEVDEILRLVLLLWELQNSIKHH